MTASKVLVRFAQYKEDFRLDEFKSVCKLFKISYEECTPYTTENPFWIINLPSLDAAEMLLSRAILIREITELIATGKNFDELVANTRVATYDYRPFETCSFYFDVDDYMGKIKYERQVEMINSFSFLPLKGPVRIKNSDVTFIIHHDQTEGMCYFGRKIKSGQRELIQKFNLKKREYLGTTSMDAELSLVMANLALVSPGSLVYDPFVGTGSFLCTASAFGGISVGSDIDGRQIRGKNGRNIYSNLKQYGLSGRCLGGLVFDVLHHPWREGFTLDAIITDPPYGVRAGAKKIGTISSYPPSCSIMMTPEEKADRYPKTIPYETEELTDDLYNFAEKFLVPGGRIVFWYPAEFLPDGSRQSRQQILEQLPSKAGIHLVALIPQVCRLLDRWLVVLEKDSK